MLLSNLYCHGSGLIVRSVHPLIQRQKYEPRTWSGVIVEPKIRTDPVISRMS
jgi:hypothetical protein